MRLLLFRSLWTNGFALEAALADCCTGLFDGIEGPLDRRLLETDIPFIAEVTTGGGYVPRAGLSPARHLEDFVARLEEARAYEPLFVTALAGADAWPLSEAVEFFGRAMAAAESLDLEVSFETHRSRPTFHPWQTAELLRQLPGLQLTCDFSHWCCVCERLVLDEEPELLALIAGRTRHVHARVGYAQGPQVPNPAAPEYGAELAAHQRWWKALWQAQARAGRDFTTMTPEFGPDGYLHAEPFTGKAVACLDEINRWMAVRQRSEFHAHFHELTHLV